MKAWKAVVMAAMSLLILVPALALGITDIGRPAITRLWDTEDGKKFACTASYIQPYINDNVSWIITAAHCTGASSVARSEMETLWAVVNWRIIVWDYERYTKQTTDVAIGTVPDVRDGPKLAKEKLWLANKNPEHGDRVYIHGFPEGIEHIDLGIVVGKTVLDDIKILVQTSPFSMEWKAFNDLFPNVSLAMVVPVGTIKGGSSGSPILNNNGRIVGILWGGIINGPNIQGLPDKYDLVLFTPVERVLELLAVLQPK